MTHTDGTYTGRDATGDMYAAQTSETQIYHFDSEYAPSVLSYTLRFRMISSGSDPDFVYNSTVRIVYDGTGQGRVWESDISLSCTDGTDPL